MTPEARKAARKAATEEAAKKRKRALDRLDGVEPPAPEFGPELEPEEGEGEAFTHASIPTVTSEEAFDRARKALMDVVVPKEGSRLAQTAEDAARRVQGFIWEPDALGLPPHMPVRPLGERKSHLFFMDA